MVTVSPAGFPQRRGEKLDDPEAERNLGDFAGVMLHGVRQSCSPWIYGGLNSAFFGGVGRRLASEQPMGCWRHKSARACLLQPALRTIFRAQTGGPCSDLLGRNGSRPARFRVFRPRPPARCFSASSLNAPELRQSRLRRGGRSGDGNLNLRQFKRLASRARLKPKAQGRD